MIRKLVDFALNNHLMILALACLLLAWGTFLFHNLPIEAYPDIADNYVTVITQWPGRSAEEVEQQVTIPVESQMNGIPHLAHLRSESLFGLSFVLMIFDDSSNNDWNRQKVLERMSGISLLAGVQPEMGSDWSTVGQIYWYTLHSSNPDFGGTVREYQVRIDPNKLISYSLSFGQVEQQLANNNINAGGGFAESGMQQMNVRAIHREDSVIIDNPGVIQDVVLMRKGADAGPTRDAIHAKVNELNDHILPQA